MLLMGLVSACRTRPPPGVYVAHYCLTAFIHSYALHADCLLCLGPVSLECIHLGCERPWHLPPPCALRDKLTLNQNVRFDVTHAISSPFVPITTSGKSPDMFGFADADLRN